MRFGDNNNATDSMRIELVKNLSHNGGTGHSGRLQHRCFNQLHIVDGLTATTVKFNQILNS
jgi:hypothetical protein